MISSSKQFIFIHIPKTGGNTIQNILKPYCDDIFITPNPHQDGYERFELRHPKIKTKKHSSLNDYYNFLGADDYFKHRLFTSIRNPYDRLLSFYFSPHRGRVEWDEKAFIEFIKITPSATSYIQMEINNDSNCIDLSHLDFVIRFENFNEDVKKVLQILDIKNNDIPWVNKSFYNKSRSLLTKKCMQAIEKYHTIDFNTFNY